MHKHRSKFLFKMIGIGIASTVGLTTLLLFVLPRPVYKRGFATLQDLQQLAQSTPELVPMSNNNTLKPEFAAHYEQFKPTFKLVMLEKLTSLATFLRLAKPPLFSAGFFKTLIETITKEREAKGQTGGPIICKVTATENSKFVIFGNLQGALHSFVRDLGKLKELNFINNKLKLTQPDTYVFFTGNVINRSSYSMETMAAVAYFSHVNPDRVFYLRGNHEKDNYWQEHALKTELQIRAAHLSTDLIPLSTQVNKFFDTLPEAAYIALPETTHEFIRVSYAGRTKSEILNENNYAAFLTQSTSDPVTYTVLKGKQDSEPPAQPIIIKAIFRDEKKRETYQPMEGLRFLAPDIDSVAWNILSCPTYVYQRAIKFKHDAFVVLEASKNIDNWKLTLYSRDATLQNPFKATTYNMLSGIDLATQKQIERDQPKKAKKDPKKVKVKKDKKKPPRSLVPSEEIKQDVATETSQLVPPPPPNIKPPVPAAPPKQQQPSTSTTDKITSATATTQKPTEKIIVEENQIQKKLDHIQSMLTHITSTLDRMQQQQGTTQPVTNQPTIHAS